MSDPIIGEIRAFPYTYAPRGWLLCNGAQCEIQRYTALYAVIGTIYGGDQKTYFNVPDLQGQATASQGTGPGLSPYLIGKNVGTEGVALNNYLQTPAHNHTLSVQSLAYGQEAQDFTASPQAGVSYASRYFYSLASRPTPANSSYNPAASTAAGTPPTNPVGMAQQALGAYAGGANPHENRQPFLPLRFCICYNGVFLPNPG